VGLLRNTDQNFLLMIAFLAQTRARDLRTYNNKASCSRWSALPLGYHF
jgi:hypothetical protein